MNAETRVETGRMTGDGQVSIPETLREAVGLVPGAGYTLSLNSQGQIVVTPSALTPDEIEDRLRRQEMAVREIAGKYDFGGSTDDYMRAMRGDDDLS